MTPERHQQIKRLFLAAVELTPPEAESFLDGACGQDDALRQEVQTMLDHHVPETLLPLGVATGETDGGPGATVATPSPDGVQPEAEPPLPVRPPGTMIAGRYRLVAPLGRGGMGVVYRAEDLELNQTVALKFLNARLKGQSSALELLRREVRTARQVSHRNVVRVFDIGVTADEVFISMEFVAGEDLQSVVRRVERLTPDKLLQVAQQLAAGLAAAHDRGILHRDLKPANVMLDGNGDVRILDFGIAAALGDRELLSLLAGTPGFVAPELLAGQPPSVQSDLYAWGLVMYFAACGELPRSKAGAAEDVLDSCEIGDKLSDKIRACLNPNPALRPRSAHELVVALSAGDPLRAAIDAGNVPPPALLLASRSWQPAPRLLDGLLAGGMLLLLIVALLADRTLFLSRCGLVKSPVALQEIAEKMLQRLGHAVPQSPVLTGVTLDTDCLQFIGRHAATPDLWSKVRAGEIPAVFFWYRQGDPRLPRPAPLGEPAWERLAQPIPGTATVRLDGRGKLLSLQVAGSGPDADTSRPPAVNWPALFESAALDFSAFREVSARRWPPLFADEVHAWEGPFPADPELPLQITAATLRGRLVFFDVDQPWEQSQPFDALIGFSGQLSRFVMVRTALWLAALGFAARLAWRNVRRGHADWQAAWRVAAGVMILAASDWLLGARHTFVAAEELAVGWLWLNVIVFFGATAGVAYLAVEPPTRRWWPWSIITTRRLLAGRLADRDVWAEVFLGLVIGLVAVALRQLSALVSDLLGWPASGLNDFDLGQDLLDSFGLRYKAAVFLTALLLAVIQALLLLSLVVALKRLTKSTLASAVLLVAVLATLAVLGRGAATPADWLVRAMLWGIAAWLLIRRGLLATIAALVTFYSVNNTPLTLNYAAWFAPTGYFILGTIVLALIVCWRLARPKNRDDTWAHVARSG
jgi:predicted Ser/Thr protein kinase